MNLETNISDELWAAVRTTYENNNYTGAIQDAVYFLSERLREKADLEGDGQALVGEALGGDNPRLKVTRLESETDWSIQKGTEFLLRGIYAAIRNPRSHEKYNDNKLDAATIICFIDYLLRVIGASKSPFNTSDFIQRVLDPDFVQSEEYASLLVDETPRKKRLEVAFRTYREKEKVDNKQLRYFFTALFDKLSDEAKDEFFAVVTDELKSTNEPSTIRATIRSLPPDMWPEVGRIARLRIENKLLDEVEDGQYDADRGRCISGSLGTWIQSLIEHIDHKRRLRFKILDKLRDGDKLEQNYVFQYFFRHLPKFMDQPYSLLTDVVVDGLEDGDKRYYDAVNSIYSWELEEDWGQEVQKAMNDFEEAEPDEDFSEDSLMSGDDDLPF